MVSFIFYLPKLEPVFYFSDLPNNGVGLLICLVCCFGCSKTSTEDSKTIHFQPTKPEVLEGKLFGPYDYFQEPSGCQILRDSILLVVDSKRDHLVHLINLNSGELISQYGTRGPKGHDLDDVTIRPPFFVDSTGGFVDLLEPSKRRFASYNIDSLIKGSNSYFPEVFITTPPEVGSPLELIKVSDSIYIGNSMAPCERLFKWNSWTDEIICSPVLVPQDPRFERAQEAQFNYDVVTVRPDNRFIIAAMYYYNRIDVFDLELNHEFSIIGKQSNLPHNLCAFIDGQMKCDWNRLVRYLGPALYATNNFFYVMSRVPLKSNPIKLADYQCVVNKFRWDGELVARVALGVYTQSFAVSEPRNELYAIDNYHNSSQKILVFKL